MSTILIAGVDEAGRGPLAGPVIAAAVIFDKGKPIIEGLADSKKLTARQREQLAEKIKDNALCYALGRAEVEEIDQINILRASLLAMKRAVELLDIAPDLARIDGNKAPDLACKVETIIGGDATIPEISAASILAKVTRDAEMLELDRQYPEYMLAKHKGYPTAIHKELLIKHGPSPVHRRSFGPVKALI